MALNELRSRKFDRYYQTAVFLPNFLSWVIVGYLAYAFLSPQMGILNRSILAYFGVESINWYSEAKWWIVILPLVNTWKALGYNTMIYFAAIANIDTEIYEAAVVDGASKWKQAIFITLPLLAPMM